MPEIKKRGSDDAFWRTADGASVVMRLGDCAEVMAQLPSQSVDAVVTDPPYSLAFMNKAWDSDFDHTWAPGALRVLKPGGCLLAFGGTRTYHRLACAVEDAGFEVRDCLMWLYGSGFPKGQGCLKPAWEPILLARKPGPRVLPLGIDECRVGVEERWNPSAATKMMRDYESKENGRPAVGRWPANVAHDGSDEVLEAFAEFGESKSPSPRVTKRSPDSEITRTGYDQFGIVYLTQPAGQIESRYVQGYHTACKTRRNRHGDHRGCQLRRRRLQMGRVDRGGRCDD